MSFADGFTKGFGLIQDAKNSAREAELRQQQLDDTAAYRNQMLGLEQANMEADNTYRSDTLAEQKRANQAAEEAAALAAENQQNNTAAQLEINKNKSQADLTREERLAADAEAERQRKTRLQKETDAARAMQEFTEQIRRVENGELAASSLDGVIQDIITRTDGSMFDLSTILDDTTIATAQQLQTELQSGNVSMQTLTRAANNFLSSSNKNGVGEEVNENFVNAPEWMRKGGYTVTNKQISELQEGKDADGNDVLYGKVRVTVTDANGDEFYYTAPLTESREGDTGKFGAATVGGEAVALNVDELLNGYRGYINAATYLNQFKVKIDNEVERNRFGDDTAQYNNDFSENRSYYEEQAEINPNADSPIPGLTMGQLVLDKGALNKLARHETLYPGSKQRGNDFKYDSVMATVRSFDQVREIEAAIGRQLSNGEIEELAGYITDGPKGLVISDKDAFQKFRNRLGGGRGSRGRTRSDIENERAARTAAGL